jgi:hypothetical protein
MQHFLDTIIEPKIPLKPKNLKCRSLPAFCLNQGKLEVKIDILVFFGLRGIVGSNVVSRNMLDFASSATCSNRRKARARGPAHLLMVVGGIGIAMMRLKKMWVV